MNNFKYYVIGDKDNRWQCYGGADAIEEAEKIAERHYWTSEDGARQYPKVYAAKDCVDCGTPTCPEMWPDSDSVIPAALIENGVWKIPSGVFLVKGTYTFGRVTQHKDGTKEHIPAKFTPSDSGGCVLVAKVSLATMDSVAPASLFGDYQAAEYLGEALDLIAPSRRPDVPNLENVFKNVGKKREECPLLEYCSNFCYDCKLHEWMTEGSEDAV